MAIDDLIHYDWEDEEGDQARLLVVGGRVELQLFDGETGDELAIYVDPDAARGVSDWLLTHAVDREVGND